MKKYLVTFTLICLFALLPSNAYAMIQVDENGNVIPNVPKDGEYTILMEPNTGELDGNSSSTDTVTPEDKAVSSDDQVIDPSNGNGRDEIYATGVQEDAKLLANKEEDNKNNDSLIIVISSILGVSLGSIGTYLFMLKRR
ncbi:MAG: hypothetical protein ACM3O4_04285 [Ignavibacteriales bacterium]